MLTEFGVHHRLESLCGGKKPIWKKIPMLLRNQVTHFASKKNWHTLAGETIWWWERCGCELCCSGQFYLLRMRTTKTSNSTPTTCSGRRRTPAPAAWCAASSSRGSWSHVASDGTPLHSSGTQALYASPVPENHTKILEIQTWRYLISNHCCNSLRSISKESP